MAVYVISSGDYSDYRIVAILEGKPKQDMDALYDAFKHETGRPDYLEMGEWRDKLSETYGLSKTISTLDGSRSWRNHADEDQLFIHWLSNERGFKVLEYNETNFSFW